MQNKELKFIEIIKNSLTDSSYLGDDCAYLKDFNLCVSADSLVEGVHFDLSFISPYALAKKALKVNISDILASGAIPKYALVCLCGKLDEDFTKEFYKSLNECALKYGVKIIGGDLTGGDKLTISITIMGDTKNRNISSRKNAKEGYILALCGNFGSSARGLKMLLENPCADNEFTRAHLDPKIQFRVSELISQKALEPYAMMDSSDGLVNALEWIKKSSNVGFELSYDKIPKLNGTTRQEVLFGGEDYSLVCVISKEDFKRINSPELIEAGIVNNSGEILIDGKNIKEEKREEFLHFD